MRSTGVVGAVCWIACALFVSSCSSGRGSLQPPSHCEEIEEYRLSESYADAVLQLCEPADLEDFALCARLDYLEARCSAVNAYRSKLLEAR